MADPRITKATSLTALLEAMREIQAECSETGADQEAVYDATSLPTFGGPDIRDTTEVWSWDVENVLVGTCVDDMEIVSRRRMQHS